MLKYSFLETGHVFLILDGEKITIKASDKRCAPLKELLLNDPENPNKEEIWKIVDPLRKVSTKHLNKTDGSAFIKDVKLSVQIENFFKDNYNNPLQNKRIYNALLTEINAGKNDLQKALENQNVSSTSNKVVIADENGLILFIDRYYSSYTSNSKDSFFNINTLPDNLKNRFLHEFSGDLPSLLTQFGIDLKFIPKLLSYLKEKKVETERFPWIIIYLYSIFSEILDKQNLHKFILSQDFDYFFKLSNHWENYYFNDDNLKKAKYFLKGVLKWSDAAIINELNRNPLFFSHLNNIVVTYSELSSYPEFLETFNLDRWRVLGGLDELQRSIYHFKQKFKANVKLNQALHWPGLKHPKKWKMGKYTIIVAQDAHDLIHWSELMSNCIHGYDKNAVNGICLLLAIVDKAGKMWINCEFRKGNAGIYLNQFNSFGNSHQYPEELNHIKEQLILQIVIQPKIKEIKALTEYSIGDELKKVDDFYRIKKFEEFLKEKKYENLTCVKKMNIKNIFIEKKEQKEFAFLKKM